MSIVTVALCVIAAAAPGAAPKTAGSPLARPYRDAIEKINKEHAAKPGKDREPDLGKKLPAPAKAALEKILKAKDSPPLAVALLECGEAALDLDLMADFEKIRARLEKSYPEQAGQLGTALSGPRYILRGLNGLDDAYLKTFAEVFDAILGAYDEVFGFKEWSKVPGKKIRVRIHREESIDHPPHFAPEFPYHSEIDFPVVDPKVFRSPHTEKDGSGKFLFYGICHELGHLIAMWGDFNRKIEEDHHAWAHYTGVTIVEHLAETAKDKDFMREIHDVRWQNLKKERDRLAGTPPSLKDRDGALATFIALHDKVGPRAIGAAMNWLDAQGRGTKLQYQRTRYYWFKDLREGFLATLKDPKARKAVEEILPAK